MTTRDTGRAEAFERLRRRGQAHISDPEERRNRLLTRVHGLSALAGAPAVSVNASVH